MLLDNHNRPINYLRIGVTDRCNLRCFYCMPEEGIQFQDRAQLMTYEEMVRIVKILSPYGLTKIRITGGEPLLRKNIMFLFEQLSQIETLEKIAITTNGTLTVKYLDQLINCGVNQINLSIDSLNRERFYKITRRDCFDDVWSAYQEILGREVDLKLNCVVMNDQNIDDIHAMVALGRKDRVSVRFIEEMPFNGTGKHYSKLKWDYKKILKHIEECYGKVEKIQDEQYSTSLNYKVPGFEGTFGIIPAYSRTFCGTCNRIRLTPDGLIKTCLYDQGVFNVKELMRAGADNEQVLEAILQAIGNRAKDGFQAESKRAGIPIADSMTTIGG